MTTDLELISEWLTAYRQSNHAAMAECYDADATFEDIAFRLNTKKHVHAMWHMICENGIRVVENQQPRIVGDEITVGITDTYVFSATGRTVVNPITCRFRIRDGLIVQHQDECNPKDWAKQALGGVKGWLAGRLEFLRKRAARKTLAAFIADNAEYA